MKKDLNIGKIKTKFQELIELDPNYVPDKQKGEIKGALLSSLLSASSSKAKPQQAPIPNQQQPGKKGSNDNEELIFTKSDICR